MLALGYLSAAGNKLYVGGLDWMNGYTLQFYMIQDGLRWGSELGVWLGQQHVLAIILSWFAIIFEGTFFLAAIFPMLSIVYVPMGFALHIGIYLAQRAPFFHFMVLYSVFYPWEKIIKFVLSRFSNRITNKPEILYDENCPLCIRSMTFIKYFDWCEILKITDLGNNWTEISKKYKILNKNDCLEEMHVILPNGYIQKGFFAFRSILRYLPLLWIIKPFFHLPLANVLGPNIYSFIANNRIRKCDNGTCFIHGESIKENLSG